MKKVVMIVVIILAVVIGGGLVIRDTIFPIKDQKTIEKYSKEYGVKPELVAAIIDFETDFKAEPYMQNTQNGLMKLTPETGENLAKEIGIKNYKIEDVANDDINIELGTYYLSKHGGNSIKEMVGNWAIRNGEGDKTDKFNPKEYAEQYYTKKIEDRSKIYKVLYFMF
ncbi:transglycosylase SLT domain-containing protein [uncultured Clostridium sp.]|uniref:transglycosylase SLT domain-containing protein n=1 Tax=uncultured Clostridium sp. TaxID=59620 RepID=UPI002639E003|nr:transglycosylase SLT domain-containing protein [uncultured Clostridium sp.]